MIVAWKLENWMRLDLLRSRAILDRTANAYEFHDMSCYRGADASGDMIHAHFTFEDYPGDAPHARISLTWEDVEAAISAFAKKEHPKALLLQAADNFASAVNQIASDSK